MTRRALDLLSAGKADAYDAALTALREDASLEEVLACDPDELEEDRDPYRADAAVLPRFLEGETLPWYAMRRTALGNRPLVCAQAFGEALDLTGWSDSAATRSTSTASSNPFSTY